MQMIQHRGVLMLLGDIWGQGDEADWISHVDGRCLQLICAGILPINNTS